MGRIFSTVLFSTTTNWSILMSIMKASALGGLCVLGVSAFRQWGPGKKSQVSSYGSTPPATATYTNLPNSATSESPTHAEGHTVHSQVRKVGRERSAVRQAQKQFGRVVDVVNHVKSHRLCRTE